MSEHESTMQEWQELLDELAEVRQRLDALELKRGAVMAAIDEADTLQDNVIENVKKIKEHLKNAL